MSSSHGEHGDDHPAIDPAGTDVDGDLGYYALRARAIEALLVEKGVCAPEEIQQQVDEMDAKSPSDGARVVARAWTDGQFKARLLADPSGR